MEGTVPLYWQVAYICRQIDNRTMSAPSGLPRTRLHSDERRTQILRAAARIFSRRGYDEVSTAELAAAAGVSRGLLSHYFRTKRDLYLAVVAALMAGPDLPLPDFVEGATVEDRVGESVRSWLNLVERQSDAWLTATTIGASGRDGDVQALVDGAVDRVVEGISSVAGLVRHGEIGEHVRASLRGYAGFANAVCREWLEHGRLTRDEVDVLLNGVLVQLVRELIPRLAEGRASQVIPSERG
jgi:AcrR family transcriptional regulator